MAQQKSHRRGHDGKLLSLHISKFLNKAKITSAFPSRASPVESMQAGGLSPAMIGVVGIRNKGMLLQ